MAELDDRALLADLYVEHARPLHHYLARRVGTQIADDLVAEAFLVFWEKRAGYDPARASPRTWLFGIATTLLRNHVRVEQRRLRAWAKAGGRQAWAEDVSVRAVQSADAQLLTGLLAGELASMRPQERDVLLLTAWADLTAPEIAEVTGVPVATVRVRLHRARTRLRRCAESLVHQDPTTTARETGDD